MVKAIRINRFSRRISIWRNKFSYKPEIFSFTEKMNRAENVLICLPTEIESLDSAKDHLTIFADIFQNKKIFVFLPLVGAESFISQLQGYETIFPQKEDLGIFSLPRKKFIQRIKSYGFEIALDLDLKDAFINSYLCLKSGALVRIGLKGKAGFPFYNLQLALSKEEPYQQGVYARMAETLKNLS